MAESRKRLTTIMSLDVAGYSRAAERDDLAAAEGVRALRAAINEVTAPFNGRIFNSAGDGFMLEFPSAASGVQAAMALLKASKSGEKPLPRIRIGLHLGDVIAEESGDLLGHGVNVAARLQALAEPGGAMISETVRAQVRSAAGIPLLPLGRVQLDKMSEKLGVYAIADGGGAWLHAISRRRVFRVAWVLGAVAAVAVTVAVFPMLTRPRADEATATRLFAQPHAWSRDVSAVEKSPRSDAMIAELQRAGGWGAGDRFRADFSEFVVAADETAARRTVLGSSNYCWGGGDCDEVPITVPFPISTEQPRRAETCNLGPSSRCYVYIHDRRANRLYELSELRRNGPDLSAAAVFVWDLNRRYRDVLRGEQCVSANSAGLPSAALMATAPEVAAGEVTHALRFTLPGDRIRPDAYVRPATHGARAASAHSRDALPIGVRLRLRRDFDETGYGAGARVLVRALKRYGMILTDIGNVALVLSDDRGEEASWAELGVNEGTFQAIRVSDFEIVELQGEFALTNECARVDAN